jgi:hypothetical protein
MLFELAKFFHYGEDLLGNFPLGVENRLGVVEYDEHPLRGKGWPKRC